MNIPESTAWAEVPMSNRLHNALGSEPKWKTVGDLMGASDAELLRTPGIGRLTLAEVRGFAPRREDPDGVKPDWAWMTLLGTVRRLIRAEVRLALRDVQSGKRP